MTKQTNYLTCESNALPVCDLKFIAKVARNANRKEENMNNDKPVDILNRYTRSWTLVDVANLLNVSLSSASRKQHGLQSITQKDKQAMVKKFGIKDEELINLMEVNN